MLPEVEELLRWFDEGERAEVLAIAEAADIAARETFGPFNDEEESPFFEADGYSPEGTWEAIAERVADAGARVVVLALAHERLSRSLIADIHAHLFGELFPSMGGRFRAKNEGASYSILVGTRTRPQEQRLTGTSGRRLPDRLRRLCDEFNDAADAAFATSEPRFVEDLVRPATKAYCKFLSAHPFIDGNGRVGYLVLQFALVRMGLLTVALADFQEHQWALGQALRRDGQQAYAQIERLIADTIRNARID